MTADFSPVDAGLHGPVTPLSPPPRRGLGVGAIVFLVVSAAAPMTTASVSIPTTLAVTGTVGMPLFYLIAGAVLLVFAVGFGMMARHVRNAGAFYSYIQAGLGRPAGLGAAVLALLSYYLLQIAMTVFLGVGSANVVSAIVGVDVPWPMLSVVLWAVIAVLGYLNVELSARVLGVLLVLETLAVLAVDIAVGVDGGPTGVNLTSFSPEAAFSGSWSVALMFAFLGFVGFEATAVFRAEAREPERTVPRATSIAIILIAVFYAATSWMITTAIGGDPSAISDPSALFLDISSTYLSPLMYPVVAMFIVTSIFAASLAFQNVIGRYQFTLSRSGVLPKPLGRLHPRHQTPSVSSAVVSVVTIAFVLLAAFTGLDPMLQINAWLSGAATLGIVVLMGLTSVSVVAYFARRRSAAASRWKTIVAPTVSALALAVLVAIVVANFPLLVGDTTIAMVLIVVVFAAFACGVAGALALRRRRPALYEALQDS
ncbi:APC family permease [Microbacterium sp. SORGH_AS_0862]|uniref:APC family permease n=1 Tax=Microbacterium sp. SORGH_AS_0862 TaxID=3041789 RepID=UPI00278F4158|nr:APC family permease [Microbacterium sp. SORGH_AS_0862]MDQ1206305.1 amino acid transporter [Microbacterium sp. SORGH_AS_0862]